MFGEFVLKTRSTIDSSRRYASHLFISVALGLGRNEMSQDNSYDSSSSWHFFIKRKLLPNTYVELYLGSTALLQLNFNSTWKPWA